MTSAGNGFQAMGDREELVRFPITYHR